MSPVTHLLIGWTVGAACPLDRRDRCLVSLSGVAPDADGLGVAIDVLTAASVSPTDFWGQYHHVLGHNLGFGLAVAVAALAWAHRRGLVAALALVAFHLHLVGDLVGAGGPDGDTWPFSYLSPFSDAWVWQWSGQWALNAWPNVALTVLLLVIVFHLAWRYGHSPLEMVSERANAAFVAALRGRFGPPRARLHGAR
jgi:inner membrane protein